MVQAIKHPFPFIGESAGVGLNLSGHVAMAAGTCCAVLLVVPLRTRRLAIWSGWGLLSALSVAIVLTRWHTLSEVLVPLFIRGGWGVAVFAAADADSRSASAEGMPHHRRVPGRRLAAALAGGGVVMILVGAAVWSGAVGPGTSTAGVLGTTFLLVAAAAALTVGVAAFLPFGWPGEAVGRTAQAPAVADEMG